jgi:CRP-like cAMP-binding protein
MKNYVFFRNISKQKMLKIGLSFKVRNYTRGNKVIKQGDLVNGFYLIKNGEFEW